jgi:two-component system response regulator TctD
MVAMGDVILQPLQRRMRVNGRDVKLTEKESTILETLALRDGPATREALCAGMYRETGFRPASLHHVDPHICRLRRKLRGSRVRISSVRSHGYRIEVE